MEKTKNEKLLMYKNRPLRRCKNEIYYGEMSDKYIVTIQVIDTTEQGDLNVGGKVLVSLMLTDNAISLKDRIVKRSEKKGLYSALDIGSVWLERSLSAK